MQRKNWKVLDEEIIHSTCWNCNSHKGLSYVIPPKSYRFSIKVPYHSETNFLGRRTTHSSIETIYIPTWDQIMVKLRIRKEGTAPINSLKQICIHCGKKIYNAYQVVYTSDYLSSIFSWFS